ncbi:hypothetical protein N5T79_10170 [Aliarcobacter cryaerophilus]|uniref:hypothetical protein n=1 Tax=Aliarcobacter cryaerophilus TaxID=28198 RepID=UPI0021B5FBFE|nr:hypothetical protein [Aliarcobacter cryaerophilus]MCT7529513.1 hypothetical protein [Aliarcobacter cryaerophilus]
MILIHVESNHIYLAFQDFEDNINDIYNKLTILPQKTRKIIKKILDKFFFDNILERQTNYVNTISTYIDVIDDLNQQYFFHLYILPKDLDIHLDNDPSKEYENILKIEKLSIRLFKLYSELLSNKKLVKLFKHSEGKNFLQLEAKFYIEKLNNVYDILLNYKMHYRSKIVCSDKLIGLPIDELNTMENNPLKNYQFIKAPYQRDLIKFVYSSIEFLKKYRLEIFKESSSNEYQILLKSINRINNLLLKISTQKNIVRDKISLNSLDKYFNHYKNNKELKKNRKLYKTIKSIFYTQLKSNVQFFVSIDLTKVFEKLIENKLSLYYDKLYVGKESEKCIEKYSDKSKDIYLNSINYLLNNADNTIKQYPDFLIKDQIDTNTMYHIIDAKYKLKKNIFNGNDIRQVLVYSILFNKEYYTNLENQKDIKKIIIYTEKSNIDINFIDNITLNFDSINLCLDSYDFFQENLFDSNFIFIPIHTLNS